MIPFKIIATRLQHSAQDGRVAPGTLWKNVTSAFFSKAIEPTDHLHHEAIIQNGCLHYIDRTTKNLIIVPIN